MGASGEGVVWRAGHAHFQKMDFSKQAPPAGATAHGTILEVGEGRSGDGGGDDGKGDKGRGVMDGTSDVRGGWWEVGT